MFTSILAQSGPSELIVPGWLIVATLLGGVGLVGLMLAMGRQRVTPGQVFVAIVPIVAALGLNLYSQPINFQLGLLHFVSWFAILMGAGFVAFRQPVYAALSFAGIILCTCAVYVLNDSPFLAAATMIVYAGAIIIVFLFVLMFAQRGNLQGYDLQLNSPLVAVIAGAGVFGLLAYSVSDMPIKSAAENSTSTVQEFGLLLFTKYLWTVELSGTLLLVASVAAIVIAQDQAALSDQVRKAIQPAESSGDKATAKGASV
jgi:NADH-quinone oxidoreductase subunit J